MDSLHTVRPKHFFSRIETMFPRENVVVHALMPPSGIGSLLAIECAVIAAIIKMIAPRQIFEFGTFNGHGTVLLAANSHDNAVIQTLDLPLGDAGPVGTTALNLQDGKENDEYLRLVYGEKGAFFIDRSEEHIRKKIICHQQNSLTFDPVALGLVATQDLILVDGGHDLDTIRNDTEKAIVMGNADAVVLWHDYKSAIHTEVAAYLDELGRTLPIAHVGNTMLAVHARGRFARVLGL